METKERAMAKSLIEKFREILNKRLSKERLLNPIIIRGTIHEGAKECANEAVNIIIQTTEDGLSKYTFWQSVKNEIEKL